jgi:simple sugar transport system ATP-binding protein
MLVIAKGRVSPSVATSAATTLMIGEWMSGLWPANNTAEVTHAAA